MACAAESSGKIELAAQWYDIVSRTDRSFTSAAFGLARCRLALGDHDGSVAAYDRVPNTSNAHQHAQIAKAQGLLHPDKAVVIGDVVAAGAIVRRLPDKSEARPRLTAEVLEAALPLVKAQSGATGRYDGRARVSAHRGRSTPWPRRDLSRAGPALRGRPRTDRAGRSGEPGAAEDPRMTTDLAIACPQCGVDAPLEDRFCEACGARLTPIAEIDAGVAAGLTNPGLVKHENQDALYLKRGGGGVVAVICDGVSSSVAADAAARVACAAAGGELSRSLATREPEVAMRAAAAAAQRAVLGVPWEPRARSPRRPARSSPRSGTDARSPWDRWATAARTGSTTRPPASSPPTTPGSRSRSTPTS